LKNADTDGRTDGRGEQADGWGVGGWTGTGGCHETQFYESNPRFVERDILGYIIKDYYLIVINCRKIHKIHVEMLGFSNLRNA
jgi:hypothetical protein